MKRIYFLVAIAVLQLLVGSVMMYGAAAPVRTSGDLLIPSGAYHHFGVGIMGAGRMLGNITELQNRSLDLFVFDDPGYASFRDGSNTVPPLFARNGTSFVFGVDLPGWGEYHVVLVDFPSRGELRVEFELLAIGLKTTEAVLGIVVLAGGLTLVGASLMISVWARRRAPPIPEPTPDPLDASLNPPPDPKKDDTRIY